VVESAGRAELDASGAARREVSTGTDGVATTELWGAGAAKGAAAMGACETAGVLVAAAGVAVVAGVDAAAAVVAGGDELG